MIFFISVNSHLLQIVLFLRANYFLRIFEDKNKYPDSITATLNSLYHSAQGYETFINGFITSFNLTNIPDMACTLRT